MFKTEPRPVLDLPRSGLEHTLEAFAIVGVLSGFAVVLFNWSALPAEVPMHFGFDGRPDSWSGRGTLFILPCVALGMYGLITVISFFPQHFNYLHRITTENAERQYRLARTLLAWVKALIACSFAWLAWDICAVALDRQDKLSLAFLPALLGGLGTVIVVYLVRASRRA